MTNETQQKIITQDNVIDHKESLTEEGIQQQIDMIFQEIFQSREVGEAYRFSEKLSAAVAGVTLPNNIKQKYSDILLKLRFTAFPMLDEDEQHTLLRKYLTFAIRNEIDIKNRIHFVFYPYFRGREDQPRLNALVSALENNEEILGSENTSSIRTLGQWVSNYKSSTSPGKSGVLNVARYIDNNQNTKILTNEEKELLKNVLVLYDWLRFNAVPSEMLKIDVSPTQNDLKTVQNIINSDKTIIAPPVRAPQQPRQTQSHVTEKPQEHTSESDNLDKIIRSMMQKHSLRVDEGAALKNEIARVFTGLTHPNDFGNRLREALPNTSEETLRNLVQSLDDTVFAPARETLVRGTKEQLQSQDYQATVKTEPQHAIPRFQDTMTPEQSGVQDIKQRLEDGQHIPREEKIIEEHNTSANKQQTTDGQQQKEYKGDDPYRESIE